LVLQKKEEQRSKEKIIDISLEIFSKIKFVVDFERLPLVGSLQNMEAQQKFSFFLVLVQQIDHLEQCIPMPYKFYGTLDY
jgi:hypothetical protein